MVSMNEPEILGYICFSGKFPTSAMGKTHGISPWFRDLQKVDKFPPEKIESSDHHYVC